MKVAKFYDFSKKIRNRTRSLVIGILNMCIVNKVDRIDIKIVLK